MEVPVVATRVTGCVDAVVDDVTGSLVPERDPEALAAAIQRYFDEPELCKAHGQAARQRAESEFQPEQVWKSLFELYVEMLESRGLPTPRSATTSVNRGWSRPTADVARA